MSGGVPIATVSVEHIFLTCGSAGTGSGNTIGPAEAGPMGTSHGVGCRQEGLPMAAPLRALNESSMVSMSLALALSRMFLYRWLWLKRSWR